ncbi:MAG: pseudoazurin [Pseudomonadota bacterium]
MATPFTRRQLMATAAGAAIVAPFAPAFAMEDGATHEVQMLNKHPEDRKQAQVFFPRVISVNAGDKVLFKSVDRGHNSASIDGMLPEGAEEWDSRINDDIEVTFDTPGFYGYQCTPHASTGMVGLIVVEGEGKLDNLEEAQSKRHRGRARKIWEDVWAEAEEMGLLEETPAA